MGLCHVADDEYDYFKAEAGKGMKKRLGIHANPLDDVTGRVCVSTAYMIPTNPSLKGVQV